MIGQYLWIRDLKTKKFDISSEEAENDALKETETLEHVEMSGSRKKSTELS